MNIPTHMPIKNVKSMFLPYFGTMFLITTTSLWRYCELVYVLDAIERHAKIDYGLIVTKTFSVRYLPLGTAKTSIKERHEDRSSRAIEAC